VQVFILNLPHWVYTGYMQNVAWMVLGLGFFTLIGALWYQSSHNMAPKENQQSPTSKLAPMIVRSPAFNHEELIPSKYTCDGEDMSPPLAIDGIPIGTVSLALVVDDPDAPGKTWDHWVLFNVPATTTRFGEGAEKIGTGGNNSWGKPSYGGPCPPSGEHRYLFKVYALDTMLDLAPGAFKEDVMGAMEGHVLESTTLMGRYTRSPR